MNLNNLSIPSSLGEAENEVLETPGNSKAHLIFEVDAQPYACPISKIQHLIRYVDVSITPSPAEASIWEVGRLAMESDTVGIPVVSLRTLWGLSDAARTTNQSRQAILIVNLAGKQCALLVDSCRCVLTQLPEEQGQFHLSLELQSKRGRAFKLATRWGESLLVVLELDKLLESRPEPVRRAALETAHCQ